MESPSRLLSHATFGTQQKIRWLLISFNVSASTRGCATTCHESALPRRIAAGPVTSLDLLKRPCRNPALMQDVWKDSRNCSSAWPSIQRPLLSLTQDRPSGDRKISQEAAIWPDSLSGAACSLALQLHTHWPLAMETNRSKRFKILQITSVLILQAFVTARFLSKSDCYWLVHRL